jgi:hypothetical protein
MNEEKMNQLSECQDTMDVANYLSSIEQQSKTTDILHYTIEAQLQMLQIVNGHNLYLSTVDLFFENLQKALELADNKQEKTRLRGNMTIMLNSMVFFMEAKIIYLQDESSNRGRELLKQGCGMLAGAVTEIVAVGAGAVGAGAVGAGAAVAKLATQLFKSMMKKENVGFWSGVIDWWGKENEIAKRQCEFENFLEKIFHKIDRHKRMLGKSIIMGELIRRYADDMAQKDEGIVAAFSPHFLSLLTTILAGVVRQLQLDSEPVHQSDPAIDDAVIVLRKVEADRNRRIQEKKKFYDNLAKWFDDEAEEGLIKKLLAKIVGIVRVAYNYVHEDDDDDK